MAVLVFALAGSSCAARALSSDTPSPLNPTQLWLGPSGSETSDKLQAIEPNPF
jgi:hypothetical protein